MSVTSNDVYRVICKARQNGGRIFSDVFLGSFHPFFINEVFEGGFVTDFLITSRKRISRAHGKAREACDDSSSDNQPKIPTKTLYRDTTNSYVARYQRKLFTYLNRIATTLSMKICRLISIAVFWQLPLKSQSFHQPQRVHYLGSILDLT